MAAPQIVPLPPFFQMSDGMEVVVTAIDPTTGATVSGVVVSNVSIDVDPEEVVSQDAKVPDVNPNYFESAA